MTKSPGRLSSIRASSLAVALTLTVSSVAAAAPGEVVRNAEARSAPFAVAPVVGSLTAGQRVDADDQRTDGWRRVRLPNGKSGFVPDDSVKISAAKEANAAPARVELLAPPADAARAPVYVGDFSHLASLVASDPDVLSLANGVAARRTASTISVWGGVLGGLSLWVLSDTALKSKSCVSNICAEGRNDKLRDVGTVLLVLGPLLGWAIRPTTWDRTDVINAWNAKHPDRPFVEHAGVTAP